MGRGWQFSAILAWKNASWWPSENYSEQVHGQMQPRGKPYLDSAKDQDALSYRSPWSRNL